MYLKAMNVSKNNECPHCHITQSFSVALGHYPVTFCVWDTTIRKASNIIINIYLALY